MEHLTPVKIRGGATRDACLRTEWGFGGGDGGWGARTEGQKERIAEMSYQSRMQDFVSGYREGRVTRARTHTGKLAT